MWQSAGICRTQAVLEDAIAQVSDWRQEFQDLPLTQYFSNLASDHSTQIALPTQQLHTWGETRNLLDAAYLILKSAAYRTESRGGHYRLDYPQLDSDWQAHTLVKQESWYKSARISNKQD